MKSLTTANAKIERENKIQRFRNATFEDEKKKLIDSQKTLNEIAQLRQELRNANSKVIEWEKSQVEAKRITNEAIKKFEAEIINLKTLLGPVRGLF